MIEIRLTWNIDAHAEPTEQPHYVGKWMPATFENRRILRIILESALEAYGLDTHWIEKRRAWSALTARARHWSSQSGRSGR